MGLGYYLAREVLACRRSDGTLGRVATIGRLQSFLYPSDAQDLARDFAMANSDWVRTPFGGYADAFFTAAGAGRLDTVDFSDYEGATLLHDMNLPLSPQLEGQFDLVIDGGSLEHIFYAAQGLQNEMTMLRTGGQLILWLPANNQCGHGFFQFSPEFFFRALTPAAGFDLVQVLLVECEYPSVSLVRPKRAFHVVDPATIGSRVGVLSSKPLMLLVRARKTAAVPAPLQALIPQQSDYVTDWSREGPSSSRLRGIMREVKQLALRNRVGLRLVNHAIGHRERRRFSLRNPAFFTPDSRNGLSGRSLD